MDTSEKVEKHVPSSNRGDDVTYDTDVKLKRELGLVGATSVVVGMIIGSGIFISPKGVLAASGSVGMCLSVWALAGITQLGSALCYSELGTMIPKAGGQYTYMREAFGNPVAFTFVLGTVIIQSPGSQVVILMTCVKYLVTLFPTCSTPVTYQKVIVALLIVTINLINAYSTRWTARVAIITTVAKVSALIVIIIGGIATMANGTLNELPSGFSGTSNEPSSLALAMYSAMWAYSGSENLNVFTEEIKNPVKTLPRAAVLGVLAVVIVYLFTNISYLAVMTREELLGAEAVAMLWGERVLGPSLHFFIPLAVVCSTLGAANNGVFGNSRLVFAAARDNNIPDLLSYIQVHQCTPLCAMLFTLSCSLLLLMPADVGTMINYLGFLSSAFNAAVFAAFLVFRFKTMRDVHRPIKVPFIIAVFLLLFNIYLFLAPLVISPQLEYLYVAIGMFGSAALLYMPFIHFQKAVPLYDDLVTFAQLVFNVCPPHHQTDSSDEADKHNIVTKL